MKDLLVFDYVLYGNYNCSCCGKPLENCVVVGESDDEEGYEWRSFHKHCYNELSKTHTPQQLYEKFNISQLNEKC